MLNQQRVKRALSLVCFSLILHGTGYAAPTASGGSTMDATKTGSLFQGLTLPLLQGGSLDEATLKGKVVLIVNVASQCGYTPQYAGLQKLHERFSARGLVVIGVPCNQFGGQEPGSPAEIARFAESRFQVSFPLLAKQSVKGNEQSPLFQRLLKGLSGDVRWNFEKFLVGRDGALIKRFSSGVTPEGSELISAIESALTAE